MTVVIAIVVAAVLAFAWPRQPSKPVSPALHAAAAPTPWPQLVLPNGTAVLSYPPSMHQIAGDTDAVTAALVTPGGAFQLYLNATPRQGDEQLQNWPALRIKLLLSDDAVSAHEIAAAEGVQFPGGSGSCVIDTYRTRIGGHVYEEDACLVQGRTSASVIVAAAPAIHWAEESPLLLHAVGEYQVR